MASTMPVLSPSETYDFIVDCIMCQQVPYIAGEPAIGKSDVVHQVSDDNNLFMIDMRLSQKLSEDLSGLPERDEKRGKAVYLPFEEFPMVGDPIPDGYDGWLLFLDELSSASEEVLAAAYSVILDHMVGGKKIHPKCVIVAAGNLSTNSAIARELPDTLITRMQPILMKVSVPDWIKWAKDRCTYANDFVVDFITKNPTMLHVPGKKEDREELEGYRNPRSWSRVFKHLNLHEKRTSKLVSEDAAGLPTENPVMTAETIPDSIFYLMNAAIGSIGARTLREEYDESISIPYPWEVSQSPASTRVPSSNAGKAQLVTSLSKFFLESDDQSRENVMTYMNRIGGEYSELFLSQVKAKLGQNQSDMRMVKHIEDRLSIDPLLGGTMKGGVGDSSDEDTDMPF